MEEKVRFEMGFQYLKACGPGGGGCVNHGQSYDTDRGKVFVKYNNDSEAYQMFEGEVASLTAILDTGTVTAPRPYKVIQLPSGGAAVVMDHINMVGGGLTSTFAGQLGREMARLHQHNEDIYWRKEKNKNRVTCDAADADCEYQPQFGFHTETCCGRLPQCNDWCPTWPEFFARKIESQIGLLEKNYKEPEVRKLWDRILRQFPLLFDDLPLIHPSLLHGDLWGGNAAQTKVGPVIFDPASFYGHSEYDFAISAMFGGFPRQFFESYQSVRPHSSKYRLRERLYQLFHYLNHWNHFGSGYKGSTVSILNSLVKELKA
ncbi:hypothetical protein Ahia01_000239000 [Argonauta hians]